LPRHLRRSEDFSDLIPWMFLKGVSTSDFSEVFFKAYGVEVKGFSPNTVNHLALAWDKEFEDWNRRDLSGKRIIYVWTDGIYLRIKSRRDNMCHLVLLGVNLKNKNGNDVESSKTKMKNSLGPKNPEES
jgi:transposase-like protein